MIKSGVVEYELLFTTIDSSVAVVPDSLFTASNMTYTHYFVGNSFALENINQDSTIRIRHHRSKNGQGTFFFNLSSGNFKINSLEHRKYEGKRTVDRLDTKRILGYNCYRERYFISEDNYIDLYVTRSIKPGFNYYKQTFPSMKGFPLQIIIYHKNSIYKYIAKKVSGLPENFPILPDLDRYLLLEQGPLKEELLRMTRA